MRSPKTLRTLCTFAVLGSLALTNARPAAADAAYTDEAGVHRFGAATAAIPVVRPDGSKVLLTARHGISPNPTGWPLTSLTGSAGWAHFAAVSTNVDVGIVTPTEPWTVATPKVRLSRDHLARFAATARSQADLKAGDRVCRTGSSALSGAADAATSPNQGVPPEITGSGASVICGRVQTVGATSFTIASSDRVDGQLVAGGDSGGPVWKVISDGSFMFVGMTVTRPSATTAGAIPAWAIFDDPSLPLEPVLDPLPHGFLSIEPSTYRPTVGGTVSLRGMLRDAGGLPIAGQTVTLLKGPGLIASGTATTDAHGNVSFAGVTTTAGTATQVALRWAGSGAQPALASRVLSLGTTRLELISAPTSAAAGSAVLVTGRLTDATGRPVVGRNVQLRTHPGNTTTVVSAVGGQTGEDGEVTLALPDPGFSGAGTAWYSMRFAGDPATNGNPAGAAASAIVSLALT